ncbi:MAG: hypothetical protein AAF587_05395 [Bacteroidota bacterium]
MDDRITDILEGRNFGMDRIAKAKMTNDLKTEVKKINKNFKDASSEVVPVSDNDESKHASLRGQVQALLSISEGSGWAAQSLPLAIEVAEFLGELGSGVLPIVQSVKGAVKVVGESVFLALTEVKIHKIDKRTKMLDAEIAKESVEAMRKVYTKKREKHIVKLGTYSIDLVGGMLDPTRVSGIATAVGRFGYTVYQFALYRRGAKIAEEILNSGELFGKEVFETLPILGCYVLRELDTLEFRGVPQYRDGWKTDDEVKNEVNEYLEAANANEKEVEKYYKTVVEPLQELADSRIYAAPFLLRNKDGSPPAELTFKKRFKGVVM